MELLYNQPLARHTTMQVGGAAAIMAVVTTKSELLEAVRYAVTAKLPMIVIGGGSNIIFSDAGYEGLVIVNGLQGMQVDSATGDVTASAGVEWDDLVQATVAANLAGLEALSYIPGSVGASPVNNIGAYGQEVKDTITHITALDTTTLQFVDITAADCKFEYRGSIFKTSSYGRYIITDVHFKLAPASAGVYVPPSYGSLQTALRNAGIEQPTVTTVRNTVIAVRKTKLPDPSVLPNTGSFFKNPIVNKKEFERLIALYPAMPYFDNPKGIKIAAGWLVEQAGLKGYSQDGIRVYEKQALVLVNDGTQSCSSVLNIVKHIQQTVKAKFGIQLEPEPEIII